MENIKSSTSRAVAAANSIGIRKIMPFLCLFRKRSDDEVNSVTLSSMFGAHLQQLRTATSMPQAEARTPQLFS
jgi:hypothetical protein